MKLDRHVAAKFEAKGYPSETKIVEGTIPMILKQYIPWLAGVTLNTKIVMTLAKSKSEFGATVDDMTALFDEAFAELVDSQEELS